MKRPSPETETPTVPLALSPSMPAELTLARNVACATAGRRGTARAARHDTMAQDATRIRFIEDLDPHGRVAVLGPLRATPRGVRPPGPRRAGRGVGKAGARRTTSRE